MHCLILNRAASLPADGFYQVEVPGEHVNHAARIVQVIDAKAVESIISGHATSNQFWTARLGAAPRRESV